MTKPPTPGRQRPASCRRRSRRHNVELTAVRNPSLEGVVLNRSRDGLAIETHVGLNVGRRYQLELQLLATTRQIEAIVRWCRLHAIERTTKGEFEPRFLTGLEVVHSALGAADSG